jgi:hypothetical protein
VALRFEVWVSDPLPLAVLETIQLRFGDFTVRAQSHTTVVTGQLLDQPALRGLLTLIWDSGGSIQLVTVNIASPSS